jgi:hypothetical protein
MVCVWPYESNLVPHDDGCCLGPRRVADHWGVLVATSSFMLLSAAIRGSEGLADVSRAVVRDGW